MKVDQSGTTQIQNILLRLQKTFTKKSIKETRNFLDRARYRKYRMQVLIPEKTLNEIIISLSEIKITSHREKTI